MLPYSGIEETWLPVTDTVACSSGAEENLLKLAELLDVPLRERNTLLVAAGFAPMFAERKLDDPALQSAREAMEMVLKGHEPFPAIAVDRHWTLLAANRAVAPFLAGIGAVFLHRRPRVALTETSKGARRAAPGRASCSPATSMRSA